VTPRRQRMLADLQLRGMSERTQAMDVRAVRQLADHDHQTPERSTEEALRDDFLYLKHVQHYSRSATPIAWCGIKCCYAQTLKRAWTTLPLVRPPRAQQLPVLLSPEEGRPMLAHLQRLRSRVCLPAISSCGLRLQEGPPLPVPHLDRARLLIHVRGGTGAQDREGPLPPRTLVLLRQSWTTPRHPLWLFPAPGRSGLGLATATGPMPRQSVQDALRAARKARGIPQRASVHPLRHRSATPLLEAGVKLRLQQDSVGHASPTTTALDTHLTATADARAREALPGRLDDRCASRELPHGRVRRDLPPPWPGIPGAVHRPPAAPPPGHQGGACPVPDRRPGGASLPGSGVRCTGVERACVEEPAWPHVSA